MALSRTQQSQEPQAAVLVRCHPCEIHPKGDCLWQIHSHSFRMLHLPDPPLFPKAVASARSTLISYGCYPCYNHGQSLGTVVQFERFLTHLKLYRGSTSTVHPYPLSPPHRQYSNRQGTIPLIFQHCIGWGGGRGHGFVKRQHCFLRQNLWNA